MRCVSQGTVVLPRMAFGEALRTLHTPSRGVGRPARSEGTTSPDRAGSRRCRGRNVGPAALLLAASLWSGLPACAHGARSAASPQNSEEAHGEEDALTPLEVEPTDAPAPYFVVDGQPFCFAGANNYYLSYESRESVLAVLEGAAAMNLRVLRIWAFLDRGSLDESVPSVHPPGHKGGVYFQYWDPRRKRALYHDGPDGLERLDFVLHHARRLGLKLVLVLTNGWRDFGGMDQYLVWHGLDRHHLFFTDARVKRSYKDWVEHLVHRRNSIDQMLYKEDPAIFAWELANEPRAVTGTSFDRSEGWDTTTITRWADEMSAFVKSIDDNHMVSVGDEGFLARDGEHFAYRAAYGVDHEALTALPHVDFGTFHLYPDHWGTSVRWGARWIEEHVAVARRLGKPTVLEEYGLRVQRTEKHGGTIVRGARRRRVAFDDWNRLTSLRGGAGALLWMLAGPVGGARYPDFDGFTLYPDDEFAPLLAAHAARFSSEARACRWAFESEATILSGPPSPYVRAVRARPEPAFGPEARPKH